MLIEALKNQVTELSNLVAKFISGEEKLENWEVTAGGQLVKKDAGAVEPTKKPRKKAKS